MNKQSNVKPADKLKARVMKVKAALGNIDYVPLYAFMFGPQDEDQAARIRNVWNLRVANEEITLNLEKLARKNKNK